MEELLLDEVTLEPATAADLPDYLRIERDAAHEHTLVTTDPKEALAELSHYSVVKIRLRGETVGFISYELTPAKAAYIAEIVVHPSMQNRGAGGRALELLLAHLARGGITSATLVTHPRGRALRFYERHGFTPTGERIENYEGSGEPRVVLARAL